MAKQKLKIAAGYVCKSTTDSKLVSAPAVSPSPNQHTEVECISSGRCQYHEDCHSPLHDIGTKWSCEWACGCPKTREGQDTLSTD